MATLSRRKRGMALLCAGLLAGTSLPACSLQTHAQKQAEAEKRWSDVRARMKFQLARQQHRQGHIGPAIQSVQEALALDANSADAWLLLAHCFIEQGKLASAREAVGRAGTLRPDSAEVQYTYGMLEEADQKLETALSYYRAARQLDDTAIDYLVAEAECLAALGQHDEAIVLVTDHLGRFDSRGTLELLLAQIAQLSGDTDRAVYYMGAAAKAAPLAGRVMEEYGRLLAETGRHREAIPVLRSCASTAAEAAPMTLRTVLAASLLAVGEVYESKALLERVLLAQPGDVRALTLLARVAILQENWDAARQYAVQLERLSARNPLPHLLRGYICFAQNDLDGARTALEKALRLDSTDPLANDLMGRILERAGDQAAATNHFRRAGLLNDESETVEPDAALAAAEDPVP